MPFGSSPDEPSACIAALACTANTRRVGTRHEVTPTSTTIPTDNGMRARGERFASQGRYQQGPDPLHDTTRVATRLPPHPQGADDAKRTPGAVHTLAMTNDRALTEQRRVHATSWGVVFSLNVPSSAAKPSHEVVSRDAARQCHQRLRQL